MPAKLTIEEMHGLAAKRGGKCLSEEYLNVRTELLWQCASGHTWTALPTAIKYHKMWCPYCAKSPKTEISEMQKLAEQRGGKCLSPQYINSRTKLKWQCAYGHVWETLPSAVKNKGRWCPKCAYVLRKKSIEDLQTLATKYGGKLLSEKYSNAKTKYLWQCADGHKWSAQPSSLQGGSWCPKCANSLNEGFCRAYFESIFNQPFPTRRPSWLKNEWDNQMELDGYNKKLNLAFEYNGKQHYERVSFFQKTKRAFERLQTSDRTKRELCLTNGVTLIVVPYTVPIEKLGEYIAESCRKFGFSIPSEWSSEEADLTSAYSPKKLQNLRDIAESRGGRCLSKSYLGVTTKHKWECKYGHGWEAVADSVINGTWCPTCAGQTPPTIDEIQSLAKSRGGICLSKKYAGYSVPLVWRCAKGHVWQTPYTNVQQGSWCHECGGSKPKTLSDMHLLAAEQDGLCLSKKYVNSRTKLLWQCANGHQWKALPLNIYKGRWCPRCRDTKLSIEYMQQLAADNDGRCLSRTYKNNHTPLEWECKNGHRWKAQPSSLLAGHWCRQCAGLKRRGTLEYMQELADRKGGKCLSTEYVKSSMHLKWECKNGHRWMAKPNNIQQGKWCRKCAIENRLKKHSDETLEECRQLALEKGGNCLSDEFINNKTPLKWNCVNHHQWKMPLTYVKRGSWCPECRKQDRRKRTK